MNRSTLPKKYTNAVLKSERIEILQIAFLSNSSLFAIICRTLFQDIELFSFEEFKELSSSMELTVDFNDSHLLMKARLDHELEERKKMAASLLALKEGKIELLTRIKSKQLELEGLTKEMNDLINLTLPLQEKLKMEITAKRELNLKAAQFLAPPLFHLYNTLVGFLESKGLPFSDIDVVINQPSSDEAVGQEYLRHQANLLLSIRQDASDSSTVLVRVKFSWLAKLKIVVCSADLVDSFNNVPASFVLSNLFKGDRGLDSPNPSSLFVDGLEFTVNDAGGFAFMWAQLLAGLQYPVVAQSTLQTSKSGIWMVGDEKMSLVEKVVHLIQERRKLLIRVNAVIAGLALKLGNKKDYGGRLISFSKQMVILKWLCENYRRFLTNHMF